MDKLHKVSHQLVYDYNIIVLEDLNVKGLMYEKRPNIILEQSLQDLMGQINYKNQFYNI